MATRYQNPTPLPQSVEEASKKYFEWLSEEESKRESTQAKIIGNHCIVDQEKEGITTYFVSGGYTILPKAYTDH